MKVLKIRIGDTVYEEMIRYIDEEKVETKHYTLYFVQKSLVSDDIEGFAGACIQNVNPVKHLFRRKHQ